MQDLKWLNGLKFILALQVCFYHYIPAFSFYDSNKWFLFDKIISNSNLQFFLFIFCSDNLCASLFLMLIAFIATVKFLNIEDNKKKYLYLKNNFLFRYFRFLPLMIACIIFSYCIFISSFNFKDVMELFFNNSIKFHNEWTTALNQKSTLQIIFDIFIGWGLFENTRIYNCVLWCMPLILWGSFYTYLTLYIFAFTPIRNFKIIYIIFNILCIAFIDTYFVLFPLGIFSGILYFYIFSSNNINNYINNRNIQKLNNIDLILNQQEIKAICWFFIGLIFAYYINSYDPNINYFYYYLINFVKKFALLFILIGIFQSNILKNFLSLNIFEILSKRSFCLILVHFPIMYSYSAFVFKYFFDLTNNYHYSLFTTFIITIPILILITELFYKFVEKPTINKIKKLILKNNI